MQTGTLKTKYLKKIDRPVNALLNTFNLFTRIETKKHEPACVEGKLNSMVLLYRPEKKVLLTMFHEGVEIDSFQSNDSLTLQIIKGKLEFHTRKGSTILNEGKSYTLNENIHYTLTTTEETVFLWTITSGKLQ